MLIDLLLLYSNWTANQQLSKEQKCPIKIGVLQMANRIHAAELSVATKTL